MLRRHWPRLALVVALTWYVWATLPDLADFPVVELAQMRIVEPAYFLAARGVYGNELLTGWYHAESAYHEYMPLYTLMVALAFKGLGPSIWAARLVSALGGLLTLVLTYRLGLQLQGAALGALGALALCVVKLAVPVPSEVERIGFDPNASGIPLLDLARVIRFDIWIPVWGLGACCLFLWAYRQPAGWGYAGVGALTGLATLTHLYGLFFLVLFAALLWWMEGWRVIRSAPLYIMLGALLLTLAPWGLYVAQDLYAYRGQMLPQAGRFDLLNPLFYVDNLAREPWRYLSWIGGSFRRPILFPRAGIWLMAASVAAATVMSFPQARRSRRMADRFMFLALPLLAFLLAALINFKRYYYILLVLPFVALHIGWAGLASWRWATARPRWVRAAWGVVLALVVVEGGLGVARSLRAARATTPYRQVTAALADHLPPRARLLVDEVFWFGLLSHPARSIHLAFLLADARYYAAPPSIAQIIDQIRPDYVVAQDYFLDEYLRPGAPFQNPTSVEQWNALRDYLRAHCPHTTFTLDDASYGRVSLYRCGEAAP